jgi:hypothetical protein
MNVRRKSRLALASVFVRAIFCTAKISTAAEEHPSFTGEKTAWHSGFDCYDFHHGRCQCCRISTAWRLFVHLDCYTLRASAQIYR